MRETGSLLTSYEIFNVLLPCLIYKLKLDVSYLGL
jgi:hypothetical protein